MWDFNNNTQIQSNQNMISHTYAKAGTYNVTLTAAKKNGKKPSDAPAIQITVSDKGTSAMFTSKTTVAVGEIVSFNSTSVDADEYTWDFGDGEQTNLTQPVSPVQTHVYGENGTYVVTLSAFSQNRTVRSTYSSTITVVGGTGDNVTQSMLVGMWKMSSHVVVHTYNGTDVSSSNTACPNTSSLGSFPYSVLSFSTAAKLDVKSNNTMNLYDGNGNLNTTGSYSIKDATHMTWAHPALKNDPSLTGGVVNSGVANGPNYWTITTLNSTSLEITYTYRNTNAQASNGPTCTPANTTVFGNEVYTETVKYTRL
jgi:PKD repeat protein